MTTNQMNELQTIQSKISDTSGDKEEELEWDTTCAKFAHMGSDGDQDKDLGKKWFAFTLMYDLSPAMLTEHLNEKAKNTPPSRRK